MIKRVFDVRIVNMFECYPNNEHDGNRFLVVFADNESDHTFISFVSEEIYFRCVDLYPTRQPLFVIGQYESIPSFPDSFYVDTLLSFEDLTLIDSALKAEK